MLWLIFLFCGILFLIALFVGISNDDQETQETIKKQNDAINNQQISVSKDLNYAIGFKQKIRFVVDDQKRIVHFFYLKGIQYDISYDNLMGCELYYNGEVVGRIQRAVVGGILAGGAGAIIGALTAKSEEADIKLKIYQNSISNPVICLDILNASDGTFYAKNEYTQKSALEFSNEVIATINVILKNAKS